MKPELSSHLFRKAPLRLWTLFSLLLAFSLVSASAWAAPLPQADAPELAPTVDFTVERVDAPIMFYDMTDRSLDLDSDNNPRIAYGGDHLYYSWYDGSSWHYETVDPEFGVGRYASLALDNDNQPHIAYLDVTGGTVKYATYIGNQWVIETVDTSSLTAAMEAELEAQALDEQAANPEREGGRIWRSEELNNSALSPDAPTTELTRFEFTSIAVDSNDTPYIAYYDRYTGNLMMAFRRFSGWDIQVANDSKDDVGKYVSIAVDARGYVHFSYLNDTYDRLEYMLYDGSSFDSEVIDSGGVGLYTSIAVDSTFSPSISYYDFVNGNLMYASQRDNGSWAVETVDSTNNTGLYTSIALTSKGRPHIVYYDTTDGDLEYVWNDGTRWRHETLYSGGDVGVWPSIALTKGDVTRISYYSSSAGYLRYAAEDADGGFPSSPPIVATSNDVGLSSSLAIDQSSGTAYISYLNDTADDLKIAIRRPSNWDIGYLQQEGNVGIYSSVQVLNDLPSVVYYDAGEGDLRYVKSNGSFWEYEYIATGGTTGLYPTQALDQNGVSRVVYYDATNQDVVYAVRDSGTWPKSKVDDVILGYNDMVIDQNGLPYISYHDRTTNQNLKYAHFDGVWNRAVVASTGTVGTYNAIGLLSNGSPVIAYFDATNSDLRLAVWNSTTNEWDDSLVDGAGVVGEYVSMKVDAYDNLHIAYYDATNQNLKYALRSNGQWSYTTVDTQGDVGRYASLALDPNGVPAISYYDATNGDLKYAHGGQPLPPPPTYNFHAYLPLINR